VDTKIFIFFRD